MMQNGNKSGQVAIVIGASMGGLLAARALADHFERVTLLERDVFPPAGEHRKGVPQGRHVHALLVAGLEILENYFPGLTQTLADRGANYGDVGQKARWFNNGGYHIPSICGRNGLAVTRPGLEAEVRARLLALPNVRVVEGCDVLGLLATPDNGRVTGVRLLRRRPGSAEETMAADLVVDAGGRGSRSPAWLQALGYERAPEEVVRVDLAYTSCLYRRRPDHIPGINAVIVAADPVSTRVGALMGQEGGRWIVTVGGYRGDHPPTDPQGLLEYVRGLAAPEIYEVIKDAEPLSEPVSYKFPANLRRRYEKLARFPEGYLVFGDALCSFNPVYGQGMTVAALESIALARCLARGSHNLARRFFKQASQVIAVPWSIAAGSDLRFPQVEGPRSRITRFLNWYVDRLHVAARRDPVVSVAFLKVINMLQPPSSLLHPPLVWRVVWGNLRRSGAREAARETSPEQVFSSGERLTGQGASDWQVG